MSMKNVRLIIILLVATLLVACSSEFRFAGYRVSGRVDSLGAPVEAPHEPTATETPFATPTQIGVTSTPGSPPTSTPEPYFQACTVTVSWGSLLVRSGPGLGYLVVGTIPNETLIYVTEEKDGWRNLYETARWVYGGLLRCE